MFNRGNIVTLATRKVHGDNPQNAVTLNAGICGMVVNVSPANDNNHNYIVDFGPEGQWNCRHNELSGDDPSEGWEQESEGQQQESPQREVNPFSGENLQGLDHSLLDNSLSEAMNRLNQQKKNDNFDVDADIKKRMEEIEKGAKQ